LRLFNPCRLDYKSGACNIFWGVSLTKTLEDKIGISSFEEIFNTKSL